MALAIVNKLLHGPTARLKEAAATGDTSLPGAAAKLFGVEGEEAERQSNVEGQGSKDEKLEARTGR